ncbi:hypothetical protein K439DRAFT_124575 [Ramaria rubella]|nr:hypothetical protein K439DRAFT_124575 [Ramaria rubella]
MKEVGVSALTAKVSEIHITTVNPLVRKLSPDSFRSVPFHTSSFMPFQRSRSDLAVCIVALCKPSSLSASPERAFASSSSPQPLHTHTPPPSPPSSINPHPFFSRPTHPLSLPPLPLLHSLLQSRRLCLKPPNPLFRVPNALLVRCAAVARLEDLGPNLFELHEPTSSPPADCAPHHPRLPHGTMRQHQPTHEQLKRDPIPNQTPVQPLQAGTQSPPSGPAQPSSLS